MQYIVQTANQTYEKLKVYKTNIHQRRESRKAFNGDHNHHRLRPRDSPSQKEQHTCRGMQVQIIQFKQIDKNVNAITHV